MVCAGILFHAEDIMRQPREGYKINGGPGLDVQSDNSVSCAEVTEVSSRLKLGRVLLPNKAARSCTPGKVGRGLRMGPAEKLIEQTGL